MEQDFIVKGNFCYSVDRESIATMENQYCICVNGISQGIFSQIPKEYQELEVLDFEDRLITPGLVDLHTHAPQYAFRGLGMDEELLTWLEHRTFPEEAKYAQFSYAQKAYEIFADDLKKSATTRACIFATVHKNSTLLLMDLLEESGIIAYVGKVNMDRNAPEYLVEKSAEESAKTTIDWIKECKNAYQRVFPILTPRFIPTCSDELMEKLREIQAKYNLSLQSHLSENESELKWVLQLCEGIDNYSQAYMKRGLFGNNVKTIMAHCVVSGEEEINQIVKAGVYVAHCPQSNTNLSSGIAPIRTFLEAGANVGLGSDIAGGSSLSMFRCITDAVQVSKLHNKWHGGGEKPLTAAEAFYLATKGGGNFFGNVGSFQKGYEFDALVINDSLIKHPQPLSVAERLERFFYLGQEQQIEHKFVAGRELF